MKKLLFSALVALAVFAFSAFTTLKKSQFTDSFYYLGSDGNWHSYVGVYNPENCAISTPTYCIYRWNPVSSDPKVSVISPANFNQLVGQGYLVPGSEYKARYNPL